MSRFAHDEILALHRELVATPSVSGSESAIADLLAALLAERGARVERIGDSLLALAGDGPLLLLDTHLDTVPPAPGWTFDPFAATIVDGRVHGLGANDAKASVAAMTAAFVALLDAPAGVAVGLALVAGEETKSQGTRDVLLRLAADGREIAGALFGEPTGLDLAVAQKGLLVLELAAAGEAAHAAHARALGAANAASRLARDLVALESVDLAPEHPVLGATTVEPTVLRAGTARNVVPAEATAILDARTSPALAPAALLERLQAVCAGELRVLSDRFAPRETPAGSALLAAAREARPAARSYGSATLSDWALLPDGVPGLKAGPGLSERSHTPDEFVLESEILAGARFYETCARAFARQLEARAGLASARGLA
jgi:acetylornithine deacetylase